MAGIERLYRHREPEEVAFLLARAHALATEKGDPGWQGIQSELKVGSEEAAIIHDWLADNHKAEAKISNHWVRSGRAYVLNNPFPTLSDMARVLKIGEKRAFLIMHALVKKRIIKIKSDFAFERVDRMASFTDLVRQMKVISKKYRGRCEPALLVRTMHVDLVTAFRLAQYGEENLGYRWKDKMRELR